MLNDLWIRCFIGLGANRHNRRGHLRRAVQAMNVLANVRVEEVSSVYETEPVGGPEGQRRYLNAAAKLLVQASVSAEGLLGQLNKIEAALGRNRGVEERWGERAIDLDILLWGDSIIQREYLTVPHPRMAERAFVLVPMAEIGQTAVHPVYGITIDELSRRCGGDNENNDKIRWHSRLEGL